MREDIREKQEKKRTRELERERRKERKKEEIKKEGRNGGERRRLLRNLKKNRLDRQCYVEILSLSWLFWDSSLSLSPSFSVSLFLETRNRGLGMEMLSSACYSPSISYLVSQSWRGFSWNDPVCSPSEMGSLHATIGHCDLSCDLIHAPISNFTWGAIHFLLSNSGNLIFGVYWRKYDGFQWFKTVNRS